jgi:hypothetical protein
MISPARRFVKRLGRRIVALEQFHNKKDLAEQSRRAPAPLARPLSVPAAYARPGTSLVVN